MLENGRQLNARCDGDHGRRLVEAAGLDPNIQVAHCRTVSRLGWRWHRSWRADVGAVAGSLAGDLDPLARLEVQQSLMTEGLIPG